MPMWHDLTWFHCDHAARCMCTFMAFLRLQWELFNGFPFNQLVCWTTTKGPPKAVYRNLSRPKHLFSASNIPRKVTFNYVLVMASPNTIQQKPGSKPNKYSNGINFAVFHSMSQKKILITVAVPLTPTFRTSIILLEIKFVSRFQTPYGWYQGKKLMTMKYIAVRLK